MTIQESTTVNGFHSVYSRMSDDEVRKERELHGIHPHILGDNALFYRTPERQARVEAADQVLEDRGLLCQDE